MIFLERGNKLFVGLGALAFGKRAPAIRIKSLLPSDDIDIV